MFENQGRPRKWDSAEKEHLPGTFPMKGQGPARRATRKGDPPLVFVSELTSGPQRAGAKRPAGWEAELEEPPAAKGRAVLCPGAASTAHMHGDIT